MSEADYLKCSCQKCGGNIEFPSSGLGETVDCPHCGKQTKLVSTPAKSGRKNALVAGSILILFILAVAGALLYWSKMRKPDVTVPNMTAQVVTNADIPDGFTKLNDFTVSKITLEKTEGSGLVNAVGTVKNITTRQRFGVKIQLDLLDAQDNKIGSTSDYIEVLEPDKEWQFKALLADPKAVKAKLTNIEEQK
jgi:hypothetical protein